MANILKLFAKYFPAEFEKCSVSWSKPETVTSAIDQWFLNVESLFPVHSPMDWDLTEEETLSDVSQIYVFAPWPAWWEEGEVGRLARIILHETGKWIGADEDEFVDSKKNQHDKAKTVFDHKKLKKLCAGKGKPLQFLPEAAMFVLKGTGNTWCDVTDEEICNTQNWPKWNKRTVDFLAKEWKAALVIHGHFMHLQAWMVERESREGAVRQLIRQACEPIKPVQVQVRLLIETLEDLYGEEPDEIED